MKEYSPEDVVAKYSIVIECDVLKTGSVAMHCPICGKPYSVYLHAVSGAVGCKYCMGKTRFEIIANMISNGMKVIIGNELVELTMDIVKRIGLLPKKK